MTPLTCEQLLGAPELGVLDVLLAALDVAILALAAAHPELRDERDSLTIPDAEAALDVIDTARALGALVQSYRRARAATVDDSSDLPF